MENKKIRFNIVDVIILVVIIAAVGIVGFKTVYDNTPVVDENGEYITVADKKDKSQKYEISFLCEEVPDFAAKIIEVGDEVVCEMSDNSLGVVTKVEVTPSRTYVTNAEGQAVLTSKEYYNCVSITAQVEAEEYEHGLMIKRAKYGVGHSITIRVGKAKIFGRVSGIEEIERFTYKSNKNVNESATEKK